MLSIGLSLAGLGISLSILICRRFLKDRRLRRSAEWARLAQHAERLGYHRDWLAEHRNMPSIASAANAQEKQTAVLSGWQGSFRSIRCQ
jgi:alkanesulfonate monooxygenase SsuD/methylene tetrahydromethanopterin reductase-like flavin-dependent oxidoreductase (luciferase family)